MCFEFPANLAFARGKKNKATPKDAALFKTYEL